ncbi:MAG: cysteine--tRNA ligase [Opitutales bacterium]|jgi:cysteinyl-tRNA synthetase|nr:cysteine--tRNA ligase [Opitutales bacterium]MDP4644793.1 cysteine--tRNA ligase [Opitutales bacterium]MDP4778013.1 cysteine--tRNA ligase [Opitutales bacterium]MDP4883855.1 cysteine--tRNA ligase [Opitutales bacterium]MDP5078839.1 cysteine--tRNA ligase [Opitutales bacterium]
MSVQLYDTLSRSIQPLSTENGKPLRFYCCGPTVYGPAHIGNFRTFLIQDTLRRVLEVDGTEVKHVRNITDLDDKTIRQSMAEGLSLGEFTAKWTDKFHADCKALNMLSPCIEPSAVAHIPQQIALVEKLIEKGHAYATEDGSVYFRVNSFEDYGRLSKLKQRELKTQNENSAGEVNDADEYDRESVTDFALWKSRKPEDGANYWPSPWGEGRPGWHLECSAMVDSAFDGETIDLHGGGIDLCFPHHENEIAQSECAHGHDFCKHWFHSAHLMVEGAKMSKSLGNLYTLDDLRAKGFDPMIVRYTLISGSYRQQLNFTFDGLHASQSALSKLERFAESLLAKTGEATEQFNDTYVTTEAPKDYGRLEKAWDALRTNLNTAACLGAIFGVIGSNPAASLDAEAARSLLHAFGSLLYALGLKLFTAEPKQSDAPKAVIALAQARWDAKQAKDWAKADELRDAVLAQGWIIKDSKEGFELSQSPK